jgi:precorrin-8X/cobalt-precorrin-8 methylmutase
MSTLFNAYLIVDWSANKTPKTGKDSIWWCHLVWDDGTLLITDVQNPATRYEAFRQIKDILHGYWTSKQRILVGFDFAYGYPAGFAQAIAPGESPPWLAVWQYLSTQIEDSPSNANNRFEVAARINRQLSDNAAPFWGCPESQQADSLSRYKPTGEPAKLYREFRLAEQDNRAHSVWKLCYPGSVGSQVLMGLPYLYRLRTDPELGAVTKVWPFETGLKPLQSGDLASTRILHAEIYPSLVQVSPKVGEIKDKLQVIALAEYLADLDYKHQLGSLFAGRRSLSDEQRSTVETEEGWILGI